MRGFITYKGEVEIDFSKLYDKKIFLIAGATGSGKTSIFDAISYALYGKVARDITSDRLRSDFLSEDDPYTFVSLEFEVGSRTYLIERIPRQVAKKSKKAQNIGNAVSFYEIVDGEKKFIADKQGETDRAIKEIIGLDEKQFSKVMLLAQGQFQEFLSAKSTDKAALLGDIFKTYEYKDIQDNLKEAARESIQKMDYIDRELETSLAYEKDIEDLIDKDLVITHDFDKIIKTIESHKSDLDKTFDKIVTDEKNLDENLKDLYRKLEAAKTFNDGIEKYRLLEKEFKSYKSEEKDKKLLLDQVKRAETAKNIYIYEKRYDQAINELKILKERLAKDLSEKQKEEETFLKVKSAYASLDADKKSLDKLKLDLENINKTLADLKDYKLVKKTYQDLDKDRKRLNNLEKKETQLEENLKKDRKVFDLANEMLREISEKGTLVSNNLKLLADNTRNLEDNYKKLKEISDFEDEIKKLHKEKLATDKKEKEALASEDLNTINMLIDRLNEDKICPVCKTKHDEPIKKFQVKAYDLGEIRKYQANINQALALREDQIEKIKKDISSDEKIKDIENILSKNYASKKYMEEKILDLRKSYKEKSSDLKIYKKNLEDLTRNLNEIKNEKNLLTDKLARAKDEEIKYLSLKDKMDGLDENKLGQNKESIQKKIKTLTDFIEETTKDYQNSQLRLRELGSNIFNKKESIKDLEGKSKAYLKDFENILAKNFEDKISYQKALASFETISKEKDSLEEFFKSMDRVRANLESYEIYKNKEEKDLFGINKLIEKEAKDKEDLSDKKAEVYSKLTSFSRVLEKNKSLKDDYDKSLKSSKTIAKLSKLADGSFGKVSGREKIDFETFVLTFYFDKVLRLANLRLLAMTDNQFSMVRKSDATDLRSRSGLDIEILDANTGKLRPVATLSGGESFLASLSLALGLSDEISMENGGIRIDTLFIDEGFGTLSKDYLENAIGAIEKLAYEDKFIGLISHVDELKEAIDSKIKVNYEPNLGSSVEVIT